VEHKVLCHIKGGGEFETPKQTKEGGEKLMKIADQIVNMMLKSGLNEYIVANNHDQLLTKDYRLLADSIVTFQDSLVGISNEDMQYRVFWLMQHSTLFIKGQVQLNLFFDGYDLELRDSIIKILVTIRKE